MRPLFLPRLREAAERNRTIVRKAAPAGPNPAEGMGLSLPPAQYAGAYESAHWGTFRIAHQGGRLTAAMGDLPILLKSTGPDRFQIGIDPGTWRDARFEVADGRVTTVVVLWKDHGEVRFARKAP